MEFHLVIWLLRTISSGCGYIGLAREQWGAERGGVGCGLEQSHFATNRRLDICIFSYFVLTIIRSGVSVCTYLTHIRHQHAVTALLEPTG